MERLRTSRPALALSIVLVASTLTACLKPSACVDFAVIDDISQTTGPFGADHTMANSVLYVEGTSPNGVMISAFNPATGERTENTFPELSSGNVIADSPVDGSLLLSARCGHAERPRDQGSMELFAVTADLAEVVQLTQSADRESTTDWTNDGEIIFFESALHNDSELRRLHRDGSMSWVTDNEIHVGTPHFSSDAAFAAYSLPDSGRNLSALLEVSTGVETDLPIGDPISWLGDSTVLAAQAHVVDETSVAMYDTATGETLLTVPIGEFGENVESGVASPDGAWLVLNQDDGSESFSSPINITLINTETGDAVVLLPDEVGSRALAWSPDGAHVVVSILELDAAGDKLYRLVLLSLESMSVTDTGIESPTEMSAVWTTGSPR